MAVYIIAAIATAIAVYAVRRVNALERRIEDNRKTTVSIIDKITKYIELREPDLEAATEMRRLLPSVRGALQTLIDFNKTY